MHHHHHSGASSAARQDAEVQARFDFEEVAAHQAMAKEMGIQWTPEPDKNFHFSLSLSRTVDDEPLRELSVVLAVTDPSGRVTKRVADVMSAPGMYHYGIDFRRDLPGAYRAQAWFDLEGRTHAFDASIPLP